MTQQNQSNLVPSLVLDVDSWIKELQTKAVEYEGMPEADHYLLTARRFLALKKHADGLETRIKETTEILGVAINR